MENGRWFSVTSSSQVVRMAFPLTVTFATLDSTWKWSFILRTKFEIWKKSSAPIFRKLLSDASDSADFWSPGHPMILRNPGWCSIACSTNVCPVCFVRPVCPVGSVGRVFVATNKFWPTFVIGLLDRQGTAAKKKRTQPPTSNTCTQSFEGRTNVINLPNKPTWNGWRRQSTMTTMKTKTKTS